MQVFEGTCIIAGKITKVAFKRPRMEVDKRMQKKNFQLLASVIRQELTIMGWFKQSSNVVSLYGITFKGPTPILVVELAKCSLDRYLSEARQRGRPISWVEKLRLCFNICEGLLALHKAKVV